MFNNLAILTSFTWFLTLYYYMDKLPCHRKTERVLQFMRFRKKRLCARCLAVYGTLLLMPYIWTFYEQYNIGNKGSLWMILGGVLALLPLYIDGKTQATGKRESNNFLRVFTGILCGLGLCTASYALFNLIRLNIDIFIKFVLLFL